MIDSDILIPYSVQGVIGELRARMRVLDESYSDQGVTLRVRGEPATIDAFRKRCEKPRE
jgi:GTP-binding protein HflX